MVDFKNNSDAKWEAMSPAEKKLELFRRQKELLDTFLSTGAISQTQHDKSLNCLIEKMGVANNKKRLMLILVIITCVMLV